MNEQCKTCANCYERAQKEGWKFGCSAGYEHTDTNGNCVLYEDMKKYVRDSKNS